MLILHICENHLGHLNSIIWIGDGILLGLNAIMYYIDELIIQLWHCALWHACPLCYIVSLISCLLVLTATLKAVPSHIMEENHLSCLYLWPSSFGDYPELVTIDEDWNIDCLLGLADLLHSPVVLSHLCAVANNWCIAAGLGDGACVHLVKVTLSTLHDVTVWPKHINRSVLSGEIGRQTYRFISHF